MGAIDVVESEGEGERDMGDCLHISGFGPRVFSSLCCPLPLRLTMAIMQTWVECGGGVDALSLSLPCFVCVMPSIPMGLDLAIGPRGLCSLCWLLALPTTTCQLESGKQWTCCVPLSLSACPALPHLFEVVVVGKGGAEVCGVSCALEGHLFSSLSALCQRSVRARWMLDDVASGNDPVPCLSQWFCCWNTMTVFEMGSKCTLCERMERNGMMRMWNCKEGSDVRAPL